MALVLGAAPALAQDEVPWRISGDVKTLLLQSSSAAAGHYALGAARLRLAVKASLGPATTLDLQYDNELWGGEGVRDSPFRLAAELGPRPYWSAQATYADRSSLYGHHRLYRGSLNFRIDQTDLRVGRQRIVRGAGRFWSPLDLLNPVAPVSLDRSDRAGVDALLVEHRLGPVARLAAVYAPAHQPRNTSHALFVHGNFGGLEGSALAGRFRDDEVWGLDLTGQFGPAVWRAEWSRVRPPASEPYRRALLGVDIAFANTLILAIERYYDGSGSSTPSSYDFAALALGKRTSLARGYLGVHASYDITPLWKVRGELIINLTDHGRYFAPSVSYAARADLDLLIGAQAFSDGPGDEFSRYRKVVYAQLQWFF